MLRFWYLIICGYESLDAELVTVPFIFSLPVGYLFNMLIASFILKMLHNLYHPICLLKCFFFVFFAHVLCVLSETNHCVSLDHHVSCMFFPHGFIYLNFSLMFQSSAHGYTVSSAPFIKGTVLLPGYVSLRCVDSFLQSLFSYIGLAVPCKAMPCCLGHSSLPCTRCCDASSFAVLFKAAWTL